MVATSGQSGSVTRHVAPTAADTESVAASIALHCAPGTRIYLHGDLGAGKTTFARGFLRALGHTDKVRSPTYTLVESYATRAGPVFHFDLYRLKSPDELEAMGFRDYFDGDGICLVEWAERAEGLLGVPDLRVRLWAEGEGRVIEVEVKVKSEKK